MERAPHSPERSSPLGAQMPKRYILWWNGCTSCLPWENSSGSYHRWENPLESRLQSSSLSVFASEVMQCYVNGGCTCTMKASNGSRNCDHWSTLSHYVNQRCAQHLDELIDHLITVESQVENSIYIELHSIPSLLFRFSPWNVHVATLEKKKVHYDLDHLQVICLNGKTEPTWPMTSYFKQSTEWPPGNVVSHRGIISLI